MKEPTSAAGWAALLGKAWGNDQFPINIKTMALDYSKRYADPIRVVKEAQINNFEGALCPFPNGAKWAILYNPDLTSEGRINFTLAHEFGHYLLHRQLRPGGFECGEEQLVGLDRNAKRRVMEQEADQFASHILMPKADFRSQTRSADFTLDLLEHCVGRYGVSRTAAALKWVDLTKECAVIVAARSGHVLWSWRSERAKQRRLWFQQGEEVPPDSWAANAAQAGISPDGVRHDTGVWHDDESVREVTIFAPTHEMTVSVLIYEHDQHESGFEDESTEDVHDRFANQLP